MANGVGYKMWLIFTLFFARLVFSASKPSNWENVELIKTVDVSKTFIRESADLKIRNIGDEPSDIYLISFPVEIADSMSLFSSVLKGKDVFIDCAISSKQTILPDGRSIVYGSIKLPMKVLPQDEIELVVHYTHTGKRYASPEYIEMGDSQTLILETDRLPFSPYYTKNYTLKVVGSTSIRNLDENNSQASESSSLGPFHDTLPFTSSESKFLYSRDLPLQEATRLEREYWVSMWSSTLEFREYYELTNGGAKLSTGFSRLDYMKKRLGAKVSSALVAMDMILPEDSRGHYCTDLVGKVSTSRAHGDHFFIKPRFPLYGGWKYNFTIGWVNDLSNFLHQASEEDYVLSVPLLNGPQDIHYENVSLSIFLPEGASIEDIQVPIARYTKEISSEFSYFDLGSGHVKVNINTQNMNDGMRLAEVLIRFKLSKFEMFKKPALISLYIFVALLSLFFLKQIDLSVSK